MKSGRCPKCQSTDVRVGPPKVGVRGRPRGPGGSQGKVAWQEVKVLGPGDERVLLRVAPGVFDHPVDFQIAPEFLRDDHHHLVVALDQGVGTQVVRALLEVGRAAGCREAWVLTERTNAAAMRLYASAGGTKRPDEGVMYSFVLDP